jgi:hypothetical protein
MFEDELRFSAGKILLHAVKSGQVSTFRYPASAWLVQTLAPGNHHLENSIDGLLGGKIFQN